MKIKIIFLLLFILLATNLLASDSITERINRYSGINANSMHTYLDSLTGLKSYYADFIMTHMSDNDLAVITPDYLDEHLTYSLKALDLPYVSDVPEVYFQHFVLPLRISQEPFEPWRKEFYDKLYSEVSQARTINDAILIADLYYQEGIYFRQTSGRDQAPLTSIKRGYGRCEEMMILQMAVFRSIGIPCRPASAPYWSFTDSNHVWTEVWTPEGWKIVPEAYPESYRKSSWEIDRAKKAPLITTEIYGSFDSALSFEQNNYDTKLNITDVYGTTVKTLVTVLDEDKKPVAKAKIHYYATTFGGLFQLYTTESNEKGQAEVYFGESSLFVTAGKQDKTGHGFLNTLNEINSSTIIISQNNIIDQNVVFNFPLDSSANKDFGVIEKNKKYLQDITDLANKKREVRLLQNKKTQQFLSNYPLPQAKENEEEYLNKREAYLSKCEELAGNADNWLYIDSKIPQYSNPEITRKIMIDLIIDKDIKDLIELPDTTAIENLLLTLVDSRLFYKDKYNYELFRNNVMKGAFGANPFPETGWQKSISLITKDLREKSMKQTVENIQQWLKENTILDNNPVWSYFGGSLTPCQYLNKKYLSQSQQIYLLTSFLQTSGLALRWQGFLEYYNGEEWVKIPTDEENEENDIPPAGDPVKKEFEIVISVDDKTQIPEPYSNFLLASNSVNGDLSNTWFDFEEKEGKYIVKYYQQPGQQNYIEGYVRNMNGDANLIIKPVDLSTEKLELNFITPKTASENNITWSAITKSKLNDLLASKNLSEQKSIVLVLNQEGNEPQERMLEQLINKLPDFTNKNINVLVYSQNRVIPELVNLNQDKFFYQSASRIVEEDISLDNYPVIFLMDKGNIITSANGFDLGLINYLYRLVD